MVRSSVLGIAMLVFVCNCSSLYVHPPQASDNPPTPSNPPDIDAGVERWECYDPFDDSFFGPKKLLTLTGNRYDSKGTVDFDGIVATTQFEIQGIERRWDWGWGEDLRSDSAFVISVDGTGRYYNFRASDDGKAKPSDIFKCKKR